MNSILIMYMYDVINYQYQNRAKGTVSISKVILDSIYSVYSRGI